MQRPLRMDCCYTWVSFASSTNLPWYLSVEKGSLGTLRKHEEGVLSLLLCKQD